MTFAALVARTLALFAFGGLLLILATRGHSAAVRQARTAKFVGYLVIVHAVLALTWLGRAGVVVLAWAIVLGGIPEARRAWGTMTAPRPRGLPLAVAAVVTGFLLAAWRIAPERAAWLFLVSGSFDGFAQVSGQLLGKHPLAPRISPAKTVEGMIGAFVGSLMVANWIRELPGFDVAAAVRIGLLIGVCALAGDLWGSWTKRRAGLKDFSQVLHGQGGVIDRFNSFVVAMALVGSWI